MKQAKTHVKASLINGYLNKPTFEVNYAREFPLLTIFSYCNFREIPGCKFHDFQSIPQEDAIILAQPILAKDLSIKMHKINDL